MIELGGQRGCSRVLGPAAGEIIASLSATSREAVVIELGAVSEAAVASLGPAAGEIIASLSATFRQGHLIGANRPPSRPKAIPAYGASTAQQIDFNHSAPSWRGATAAEPQKETTMDPTDQFKTYQSDPRLQHRDGNRLILERRVAALWKRGLDHGAIALALRVPAAAVADVIMRCAPAETRRGN